MEGMDLELVGFFCDEALDLLNRWEALALELEKDPSTSKFDELFRIAHNLKGSSRSVGLDAFGNFIHHVEDGITLLKTGKIAFQPDFTIELLKVQAFIVQWVTEIKTSPTTVLNGSPISDAFMKALTDSSVTSDESVLTVPETVVTESIEETVAEVKAVETAAPLKKSVPENKKPTAGAMPAAAPDETVRVSAKKIELLIEMMGELSIHQAVVYHTLQGSGLKNGQMFHSAYLGRKITRELYEKTLALRMVPIQPVFQRLERTVREMARSLGKTVDVEMIGGEVELDKTVCEKIVEPLTHMVRNSVDHGVESPEAREQVGKPRTGNLKLTAVQESGSVTLLIEDDGKGLNPERIRAKAELQGLVKPDDQLDAMETLALIFLPGFSTAEKVTEISGRGVGMDVVMKTVESLKGEIKIGSELGKGTKFQITLPTTLSIIDALVIKLNGNQYAVPVNAIDEIVNLNEILVNKGEKMMKLGGHVIPVEDLSVTLKIRSNHQHETRSILVAKIGQRRVAFRVDEVCEQQQIVVKKFSSGMGNVFGLAGGTILADGQPGLIVDLNSIAESYLQKIQPTDQERVA